MASNDFKIINQYNNTCNSLKQKVHDHEIYMQELLHEIAKATELYFQHFHEFPPRELLQDKNVNSAIPVFKKRKAGITTLQELENIIIHHSEYLYREEFKERLIQLNKNEYNSLVKEIIEQNKGTTIEEIHEIMKGYVDTGIVAEKKAERILKDFKTCSFYRCSNVFYTGKGGKNKNSRFCSNRCRYLNHNAELREKRTGTKITQSELIDPSEASKETYWKENRVLSPAFKKDNDFDYVSFEEWTNHLGEIDLHWGIVQGKTLQKLREEQRIKELEEMNRKQPVKVYRLEDLERE